MEAALLYIVMTTDFPFTARLRRPLTFTMDAIDVTTTDHAALFKSSPDAKARSTNAMNRWS
jgi:hypothetical protein